MNDENHGDAGLDSDDAAAGAANRHIIPAIDRMMAVLTALERHAAGLSVNEVAAATDLPRTTVYRTLNSLEHHAVVSRDDTGTYRLGRRLLSLAAHVASQATDIDIAAIAQPFLDRMAADLGEGIKLSVLDGDLVLVLAVAQGRREYALTVAPGQRMPLHAGAASKVLLAHLPRKELDPLISRPLLAFTPRTITDPAKLRAELARVRRSGWAQDRGENGPSIHAFAAPVFNREDKVIAALSVPYLAGTPMARMEQIRTATIEMAAAISAAIPAAEGGART